jgi:hypothetical protein
MTVLAASKTGPPARGGGGDLLRPLVGGFQQLGGAQVECPSACVAVEKRPAPRTRSCGGRAHLTISNDREVFTRRVSTPPRWARAAWGRLEMTTPSRRRYPPSSPTCPGQSPGRHPARLPTTQSHLRRTHRLGTPHRSSSLTTTNLGCLARACGEDGAHDFFEPRVTDGLHVLPEGGGRGEYARRTMCCRGRPTTQSQHDSTQRWFAGKPPRVHPAPARSSHLGGYGLHPVHRWARSGIRAGVCVG